LYIAAFATVEEGEEILQIGNYQDHSQVFTSSNNIKQTTLTLSHFKETNLLAQINKSYNSKTKMIKLNA
jgi:hypothetical protein